jgi:hypothetical protein
MERALEHKNRLDDIVKAIQRIFDPNRLRLAVEVLIRRSYNQGMDDTDHSIKMSMNPVPNPYTIQFLSQYTFDNVKGMNESLAEGLRKELVQGIMHGENERQLAERVKSVFEVNYVRARAIARTESHRAYNVGGFEAAKQSGLKLKKQWYNPSPQTTICKTLVRHKPIPLNEPFVYDGENFMAPPGHVNCRSRILYVQEESA